MKRSGGTRYMYLSALITVAAALTACTPKTSLEQHTRHYVYASDDGFDPNFYTKKADTTRMMIPFFQQFREMGVKDKAAGVSAETAQQRIKEFHSEEFLQSLRTRGSVGISAITPAKRFLPDGNHLFSVRSCS
ncbi:Exc2 family lipoprotein [Escherichia coli]